MSKYPDILNIPTSTSFRDLQETQVTLLFDTPKEFEGKFGPQWKYSVESGGTEYTLFASAALHRQIQETFPTKGTTVSIARVGEGKETKWDVVYVSGPKGTGDSPQARERIAAGAGASTPRAADPSGYNASLALYWEAFDSAVSTLTERGLTPQVDANAVAFVIYKLAKDHGISSVTNPNVNPVPATVSTQEAEEDGKATMKEELIKLFKATDLHETRYFHAISAHAPEGTTVKSWDDVTRDTGLATYAAGKNVQAGLDTWDNIISPGETTDQEELPF
jgi:hypothetical protein